MQPPFLYSRFRMLPIRHYKFHKTPRSNWVLGLLPKPPCVRRELNPWRALTSSNFYGLSLAASPGHMCIETKEPPLSTFQHPSLWANPREAASPRPLLPRAPTFSTESSSVVRQRPTTCCCRLRTRESRTSSVEPNCLPWPGKG